MRPFRRKRGRDLFRTYELAVIDALRAALPGEAAAQYAREIEAVEVVSRMYDDATVTAILGQASFYHFRPAPKRLGAKNGLAVTKVKLRIDPTKPDDGSADRQRLAGLAPAIRSELALIWAERPAWAASVVEPAGAYRIELEDGAYLILAQLEDTTFVVAGVDPPRPGVRRYDPEGDLIGEFPTVGQAITAETDY